MSSIFLITGIVLILVIGLDILIGINNILLLEIIKTLSKALWKTSVFFLILDILYAIIIQYFYKNVFSSSKKASLIGLFSGDFSSNEWFILIWVVSSLFFIYQIFESIYTIIRDSQNKDYLDSLKKVSGKTDK
ncbi:hypothetical protein [Streptococcus salivarius]|uniref:hypothetical protein n=1 Tax=Streptococcus salivarius TaxID=1304 RepID=UPI001919E60D|nr:hypothetical protein [Streptococcus salivarius]